MKRTFFIINHIGQHVDARVPHERSEKQARNIALLFMCDIVEVVT